MKMKKNFFKWGICLLGVVFVTMVAHVNAGLSNSSKFLGNIIAGSVPTNFSTYWNQVTSENGGKWGTVESSRDSMNWTQADTAYNYARRNGFSYKYHTLIWGSQQPGWISSLSASEQKAEILEWMDAVAARYKDAEMIDVVNEPLHAPPTYKNAIGGDGATGWDWVIWSFREARKRFGGKLLINEYGIISDPNATANYIKIIKLLQGENLIDGIGIQCHQFNMDTVSTSTMKSVLNTLAATGLPIYVSELDITGDDSTQLARYKEKFPVLWEHPAVKGVTLWGYIQGQTWKENTHLITSAGSERPALTWLRQYLGSSTTTVPPTGTITVSPSPTPSSTNGTGCTVSYSMNDWGSGATVSITIKNNGTTAINGWKLAFSFSGNQKITNLWNGTFTQSGTAVTISNASYNSMIPAGGTVNLGFNLSYSGTNAKPTSFALNGQPCRIQ